MLRYYLEEDKKVYTIKKAQKNNPTQEAHYKFIKLKDVKQQ